MRCVNLNISGDVQGVGFRAWVKKQAERLGLTGWVRNRSDGSVEVVVQGDENSVEKMIELCWQGPEVSWVEDVVVEDLVAKEQFIGFEVRPTI